MTLNDKDKLKILYKNIRERTEFNPYSVRSEELPKIGEHRWGLSAVIKGTLPQQLVEASSKLATIVGNNHCIYDSSNFHFTFRSIEGYRENISHTDSLLAEYRSALNKLVLPSQSQILIQGVIPTPQSIITCGYPNFSLQEMRMNFHSDLAHSGLVQDSPEPSTLKIRQSCHGSMCLFGSHILYPEELLLFLDQFRNKSLGTVTNLHFDLVAYQRTPHSVGLVSYL